MSLFVERKETRMATARILGESTLVVLENDVHQQQNFVSEGFDSSLKIMPRDSLPL